jgi:hypothetical protein
MKILFTIVLSMFIMAASVYGVDYKKKKKHHKHFDTEVFENADIEIEDGSILIFPKYYDDQTIEITDSYELFINGREIDLDDDQQELIEEFHTRFFALIEEAKEIGIQGAAIGLKGAGVGIAAIAGICKLIDEDYDTDDLEKELEEKTKELEEKAEELEEQAEALEDLGHELETLAIEIHDEIPEIRATGIFED